MKKVTDPATYRDRNACYSDRFATVEAAGFAPFSLAHEPQGPWMPSRGFVGLVWSPEHQRMVSALLVPNHGPTMPVMIPGRWW